MAAWVEVGRGLQGRVSCRTMELLRGGKLIAVSFLLCGGRKPMSAFPDSEVHVPATTAVWPSPVQYAVLSTALAVLGLSTIWPTVLSLWFLWTTDALKSIGMAIPLVSLILILRVWRKLEWETEGTWWGLALLLVAIVAAQMQARAIVILVVSPQWSTGLPPPSLVSMVYGSGAVLLFGGVRLFRAALFPILLLWFVNPVPHVFSLWIDLPLQSASAHIARAFAMDLGQTLTQDRLRLMFTPEFGMFIAPGCNGIRGSVTMGFIALIAGYVYRFRWYANALVVMGAILLGYVFNLARLCLLVLYYMVALHYPSLQGKAENADYLIGAALFLLATFLLFGVIHRLRDNSDTVTPEPAEADYATYGGTQNLTARAGYVRLAAMAMIVLYGCAGLARAYAAMRPPAMIADAAAMRFPQRLGKYALVRTWNEALLGGQLVYVWAQYAPTDGGTPIAIGVSPALGWHDPLICHAIRGEHPLWQGPLTATTAGAPVNFSSAFYSDGVTQYLEASTECSGATCNEFATERTHFGLIFSRPDLGFASGQNPQRPIPVLLRAETMDMTVPADAARQRLTGDLRGFLGSVRLVDLTRPFSH